MKVATRFLAAVAAVTVVAYSTVASAASINFSVDPSQSFLAIAIGAGVPPDVTYVTTPQSPGSDSTALSGAIAGDISGGLLTLFGGNLDFALQPDPQQPDVGGAAGSAPAQIGLILSLPPLASGPVALRELTGDITSTVPTSIAGGVFDGTTLDLSVLTGFADINLSGLFAVATRADMGGNGAANEALGATISNVGNVYTISVPLLVNVVIPAGEDVPLDLTATLTGHLVATGVLVPEPGTIAMLGVGLVGLVAVGRRRFRKA